MQDISWTELEDMKSEGVGNLNEFLRHLFFSYMINLFTANAILNSWIAIVKLRVEVGC